MMEAARTSETSVNLYQTTERNNPEDKTSSYSTSWDLQNSQKYLEHVTEYYTMNLKEDDIGDDLQKDGNITLTKMGLGQIGRPKSWSWYEET
jgi:hypothetical protein